MRRVRTQLSELIAGLAVQDLAPMSLGLSHSLSRYRLKVSADKVCLSIFMSDKPIFGSYFLFVCFLFGVFFGRLTSICVSVATCLDH